MLVDGFASVDPFRVDVDRLREMIDVALSPYESVRGS